jgi:hypothetical protein
MEPSNNPYYPYQKVADYTTMPDAETLLKKIVDYLIDLPMKGYTPPSDTSTPRSRLIRLLYYDTPHPLDEPLPTPQEKLSIVFDPESADVAPTDKGYRIYPMIYPIQAQSIGQTTLRIFMGYAKPMSDDRVEQSVEFRVLTNTQYENNQNGTALSRTYQICLEIIRALHGVNIDGIGGFYYNRKLHTECGLEPIADESQNVGYRLVMGLTYMGSDGETGCRC